MKRFTSFVAGCHIRHRFRPDMFVVGNSQQIRQVDLKMTQKVMWRGAANIPFQLFKKNQLPLLKWIYH